MSLQVCHCGWSKVTTPHGLRTHQGKMGCNLKSARVPEGAAAPQPYTWSAAGLGYHQEELVLDGCAFKTDSADFYSDKSLQVCHCGWSKMTTYQGLRIHQGKMGCTPKGKRIPKSEQWYWTRAWEREEEQKKPRPTKRVLKQEMPQTPTVNVCSTTIKEEYNISVAVSCYSSQSARSPAASHTSVNRSDRERPAPAHPEAAARPKEENTRRPPSSQEADAGGMMGTNRSADYATTAAKIKVEPKSPSTRSRRSSQGATASGEIHQLQDSSRPDVQVNQLIRKAPGPVPAVSPKEKVRRDRMLSQNASASSRGLLESAAAIRQEPRQPASNPHRSLPRLPDSESGGQPQDSSAGLKVNGWIRPAAAVVQPNDKHGRRPSVSQDTHNPTSNIQTQVSADREGPRPQTANEASDSDAFTDMTVKQLAQMFSAATAQAAADRPEKKHRTEPRAVKLNPTTAQEAAAQPQEKDRDSQQTPVTRSGETQRSSSVTEDPKPRREAAQGVVAGMKVKELVRRFSAAARQETVRSNQRREEEPKRLQVKLLPQRLSSAAAQETKVCSEDKVKQVAKLTQQSGRQGGLDALRLQVDLVFAELMEVVGDWQHKSRLLPLCSLRTTTVAMMGQIQQRLDKLSLVELKWISKFAVDMKLDPTTAHRCLVSADGMKVTDAGQNQAACDPPGGSGSVLGLSRLPAERSYWEVEVSSQTGWDVGVARGDANRQGNVALNPENGFWVLAHYESKAYAAMDAQTRPLPLRERPQRVGVFVNYEDGRVSFYDASAQTHIYSFTDCAFTSEIFPYFSLHPTDDGSAAEPLTISAVTHQREP